MGKNPLSITFKIQFSKWRLNSCYRNFPRCYGYWELQVGPFIVGVTW